MYWSGEKKAPDTTNPTLLKNTVLEMVESRFGQESLSVVTLTCMCSMEGNGILDVFLRPHVATIGNDFILMDDNVRHDRAVHVEDYF